MNPTLKSTQDGPWRRTAWKTVPIIPKEPQAPLRKLFWLGVAGLALTLIFTANPSTFEGALGGILIIVAALFPSLLWVNGHAPGIPIFPIFALTYLWTYGLPLLYFHPLISLFSGPRQFLGAATVTGFLICATVIWAAVNRRAIRPPATCLVFSRSKEFHFFPLVLTGCLFFNMASLGGWIDWPAGTYSFVSAAEGGLSVLASFVLSYRLARGQLTSGQKQVFITLLVALVVVSSMSLLLVGAMSILGMSLAAFTFGSKRVPWRVAAAVVAIFAFLHYGKGELREKYWNEEEAFNLQPWQYPSFLNEWADSSLHRIWGKDSGEETQSLQQRASLMHLLLFIQKATPGNVPYLMGETYQIIPLLLVPRWLMPDKPRSHEGTYILNIHYGFQTREDALRTTIGFGLLNEAYANFGFVGLGMLAVILGGFYGAVSLYSRQMPLLSFRSLFGMIVASYAFQTEFCAGVYVAALFQSTMILFGIALVFMKKEPLETLDHSTFLE